MEIWKTIEKLTGTELATLDRRRQFVITAATDDTLLIKVKSTSQPRSIARQEIETAWQALETQNELSRSEIEERFSPRNPAYVASVLAMLPGVQVSTRPIVLRLK